MRQAFMSIEQACETSSEGMTHVAEHADLGILAHVDAGKTTLTERLPDAAGSIDKDRPPHCSHASWEGSA